MKVGDLVKHKNYPYVGTILRKGKTSFRDAWIVYRADGATWQGAPPRWLWAAIPDSFDGWRALHQYRALLHSSASPVLTFP